MSGPFETRETEAPKQVRSVQHLFLSVVHTGEHWPEKVNRITKVPGLKGKKRPTHYRVTYLPGVRHWCNETPTCKRPRNTCYDGPCTHTSKNDLTDKSQETPFVKSKKLLFGDQSHPLPILPPAETEQIFSFSLS